MAFADTATQSHVHYRGLRDWLDKVQGMGELLCVNGADWNVEMGSITQMLTEKSNGTAPAILFDEIPGYPKGFRTLYGHFSSLKRVALTLGLPLQHDRKVDIVQRYHHRMQNMKTLPPRFVKDGPVLQNVLEGDKIDVLKFPVPLHHEKDKARYIGTACCVMTQDPDSGWFNLGAYRSQVYDRNTVGCQITEGKHGRIHRDKNFERGKPMKVAIVCGQDPLLFMLASSPLPEISELDIAGGLRGEPIDVIRGPYTGFPIPADAEIVLEGETVPGQVRPEGPFGEWMGYYSDDTQPRPYVNVKIDPLSQRSDPVLRAAAQAGRRDRPAQGHRRRRADLERARRLAACRRCSACGITRPVRRRASPSSRSSSAIPATRGRRCTSPPPARAAPMPASGRWWWTRTSTPASSTRCCGRCARGSIRTSTSTSSRRPGRRSAIRCSCPATSTTAS